MNLTITDKAATQLATLRPSDDKAVRIACVAGGCSGVSYKLDFIELETITSQDKKFELRPSNPDIQIAPLIIAIDPKSWLFLNGLTVDFDGSLNGKGFTYTNPNAKGSCGCGTSFSV